MLAFFASMFLRFMATAVPDATRAAATRPSASAVTELIRDPIVLNFCSVLARKARSERFGEQGAFVVRTGEGMLYFVAWPPSGEKDILRWYGRFPDGTVAIVHTHPPWQPIASKLDIRAARGARIPIYVLTPFRISKTTGGPSEVVMDGDWVTRAAGDSAREEPARVQGE